MQFRQTYQGPLKAARANMDQERARAADKHQIRRRIHRQLKRLWAEHPSLREHGAFPTGERGQKRPYLEWARDNWRIGKFNFIPLVTKRESLYCKLEILMLRFGQPGRTLGDIDNRLKTLFDALQKPQRIDEIGPANPKAGEDPFFVLMENDEDITHVSVETDRLLRPLTANDNDVHLIITVSVRPFRPTIDNDFWRD